MDVKIEEGKGDHAYHVAKRNVRFERGNGKYLIHAVGEVVNASKTKRRGEIIYVTLTATEKKRLRKMKRVSKEVK